MKLNRLLEITTILLNKKKVTAEELAERFGVSTRTIYRDIDALSASGVPVFAVQGLGGGISLLDEYTISRAALTSSEKESVLFALQILKSTKCPEIDTVLEKLGSIFKNTTSDWISIDFTSWGAHPDEYNKFTDIRNSILQCNVIEMEYINSFNEKSSRRIEPVRLIYKANAWYLWGYCMKRQDYRTFKITRIKKVVVTDETFERGKIRQTSKPAPRPEKRRPPVHLVLEFTKEALYRLCDDYNEDMIQINSNGTYTLEVDFPEDEWVYGYIMSFGPYVKVLEPEHIRNILKERCKKILNFYATEEEKE